MEGDVAEAEGGHYRERPVKAGYPAVLMSFVEHQQVEQDAVEGDGRQQEAEEFDQQQDIFAMGRTLQQKDQLNGQKFKHVWRPERAVL